MLFQSWTFISFFCIFFLPYLLLKRTSLAVPWLLAGSYAFYAWWNPRYLILLGAVSIADYLLVTQMARSKRKGLWLGLSIACDLGLLGFFKYAAFLASSFNGLLAQVHVALVIPVPDVALPVGISFFIFQSMNYTIDVYRGAVEREPNLLRYAAFVSMFPQLLSGPIERARNMLPQLRAIPRISGADAAEGLSLFVVGLFKKVALADYLRLYVDKVYAAPGEYASPALALATLAFAWQIYFDFSGYTDMARGVARLLGFRLMLNFNHPYLASGLREFWERWHISLSTWFRDYVYISLGGNRHGSVATYCNMALTMLISGLWHGASWTFVAWGGIHALGRVMTRRLETTGWYRERVPHLAKVLFVFCFVSFAWIFFRAESFERAWRVVTGIVGMTWADPGFPLLALVLVGAAWLYEAAEESRLRPLLAWAPVRIALIIFMVLYLVVCAGSGDQPFYYFQF
jgi:alginate O-acetyltransferase complex protein AlgI